MCNVIKQSYFSDYFLRLILFATGIVVSLVVIFPRASSAKISSLETTLGTPFKGVFVSSKSLSVKSLRELGEAEAKKQFDLCLKRVSPALRAAKSIEPWILVTELNCARQLGATKASANRLNQVLWRFEKRKSLLLDGPWAGVMLEAWQRALVQALEWDVKFARARAWSRVETLTAIWRMNSALKSNRDPSLRARAWKAAADLLFATQNQGAALGFYERSLAETELPEVRSKIDLIKASQKTPISLPPSQQPSSPVQSAVQNESFEGTAEERELMDRVLQNTKTGDLVAAVEDAIRIMRDFPGSVTAKQVQDKAIEIFVSVAEKSDEKFIPIKTLLAQTMVKADGERLAQWARRCFNRGLWADALYFGKRAVDKIAPSRAAQILEMTMDAAIAVDDFDLASEMAQTLLTKYAGTASGRLAQLRVGLLAFRKKDWAKSSAAFEKMIAVNPVDSSVPSYELQARYWLWRSLQKQNVDRARQEAMTLSQEFPFSYYGLRARLEISDGKMDWGKENPIASEFKSPESIKTRTWLTSRERLSFERAAVLSQAGWYEQARAELATLPEARSPVEKAVRAKTLAEAKGFLSASRMANQAWDADFSLRRPELMRAAWPDEFRESFELAAKRQRLSPLLSKSLTKQESGFSVKAISSSGALGLMQMIPPTALEIASDMKIGKLSLPEDMFEPDRNIQMGSYYLSKMLTKFGGSVPVALAAYNAGPTRVERWVKSRPSLAGIEAVRSSEPEDEVWIDEFPFSETSFYVKAILRNIILYQVLEKGEFANDTPLWKAALAAPGPTSSK